MSTCLTVAGAVFEVMGLGVVFIELAVIRTHEFGVPTPWAGLGTWVRRLLRRPQVIEAPPALSAESALSLSAKKRPGPLADEPTLENRVARLERYADCLDKDVDTLHQKIDRKADEVIAEAERHDDRLREELERRDEQRRTALRPSLRRQGVGAGCVLVGIVLGMLGSIG